jgi:hypothetical protein
VVSVKKFRQFCRSRPEMPESSLACLLPPCASRGRSRSEAPEDPGAVLPVSGQIFENWCGLGHYRGVPAGSYDDLVAHLARSTPLSEGESRRVVAEVLSYFAEPVADFVRRRHRELRSRGIHNDQIFAALPVELATRRVAAPALSARQLRRIVYG